MTDIARPIRQYHRVTDERLERLFKALEAGYSRTAACAWAGITTRHFYRLLGSEVANVTYDGIESEGLTFRECVEIAEARAQAAVEGVLVKSIPLNPSLAWRFLERRCLSDWQDPESRQRIEESRQRVALATMEERIARLEEELMKKTLEGSGVVGDTDGS